MIENTTSYKIAFSMYVALGGNPNATFESVDAIYDAIDVLFGETGQTINIKDLNLDITENGNYTYNEVDITGYKPVEVNVNIDTESYYNNGYTEGFTQGESEGYNDGYVEGLEDGAEDQKALLETITISENGTYTKEDGYKEVIVEVASSGGNGFDFTEIGYSQSLSDELNSTTLNALEYSKELLRKWNAGEINNTVVQSKFQNYTDLVYCPALVFDNANNSHSNAVYFNSTFKNCINLKVVGNLTFTKPITTAESAFDGCSSLTSIPQLDTSKVTSMSSMFDGCSSLTSIPQLDTSNVVTMGFMFDGCSSLTSIPQLDTSKVTSMSYMFTSCRSLTTIPQLDTSKVNNMSSMFSGCSKLTSIPLLDCSSVTNISTFFGYSNITTLTDLGGFKDLGKKSSVSGLNTGYFLRVTPNITYESIMNVINNLYDRTSAEMSTLTLYVHANTLKLLSDADKAIATNKGWTLS